MKKTRYLLFIVIACFSISCEELLDIKPTNIISDVAVKNDPVLIQALYNNVHSSVQWHTGGIDINMLALSCFSGEATLEGVYGAPGEVIDERGAPGILEYWPYNNIRSANELILLIVFVPKYYDPEIRHRLQKRWRRLHYHLLAG